MKWILLCSNEVVHPSRRTNLTDSFYIAFWVIGNWKYEEMKGHTFRQGEFFVVIFFLNLL